jgi:glycosyltransferase involved in cell wall biosynthesis
MIKDKEKVEEKTTKEETPQLSQNEFIDLLVNNIKKNDFNIHFYAPAVNTPSGGVAVLLRLAKSLTDSGFKAKVWYEPTYDQKASFDASNKQKKKVDLFEKFDPKWVDFDLSNIEFVALGEKEENIVFTDNSKTKMKPLKINTEDFLIIPEGFPNVMEKTAHINAKRIVLAQSWIYILSSMKLDQTWQQMGVFDAISVSDAITEFIDVSMPGIRIKNLKQGINRDIFKVPAKMSEKYPCIGFMKGRDAVSNMKIANIIKLFRATNPHFKFVRFIELSGLSREEFAERLRNCAFVLYTDDIAGFGTLPLEAMACGTHVIGWAAYGSKEYVRTDNGFWSNPGDVFTMVEQISIALERWLSGDMDIKPIQEGYETILSNYTVEGEFKRIVEIFEEYKNERINELERAKK